MNFSDWDPQLRRFLRESGVCTQFAQQAASRELVQLLPRDVKARDLWAEDLFRSTPTPLAPPEPEAWPEPDHLSGPFSRRAD